MANLESPERGFDFREKIIIVTGANEGIGAATAHLFAKHGGRNTNADAGRCRMAARPFPVSPMTAHSAA
jgi:NAD(P)-dependent dehydrogenase (short-subunit alcohol dehydrogenase family)